MACCLTAPSHYLNQYWLVINEALCHLAKGNFTETILDITPYKVFDSHIFKKNTAASPRCHGLKTYWRLAYVSKICDIDLLNKDFFHLSLHSKLFGGNITYICILWFFFDLVQVIEKGSTLYSEGSFVRRFFSPKPFEVAMVRRTYGPKVLYSEVPLLRKLLCSEDFMFRTKGPPLYGFYVTKIHLSEVHLVRRVLCSELPYFENRPSPIRVLYYEGPLVWSSPSSKIAMFRRFYLPNIARSIRILCYEGSSWWYLNFSGHKILQYWYSVFILL